jgi:hypothetical protein
MADLSMTLTKLKVAVSYALGYGSTYPSGSTEQAHVDRVLDRGLGQFYMPGEAGVPDIPLGHKWSFLSPQTTIVLWATTTGTVSGQGVYSSPSTTITATAAKFYTTMVGHSFTFDTSSTDYTITSVGATATASTAADTCVVTGDASSEASGDTFTITADGDYRLPDDWGSIASRLVYSSDLGYGPLGWCSPEDIRRRRNDVTSAGHPSFAAIAPVSQDGSAAQKWNVMTHQTADSDYTMHYRYNVLATALGGTSTEYPYGGANYGEVILASCLAVCELEKQGSQGGMWANFADKLRTAIQHDRAAVGATELGPLTRPEEAVPVHPRDWIEAHSSNAVVYDGITY